MNIFHWIHGFINGGYLDLKKPVYTEPKEPSKSAMTREMVSLLLLDNFLYEAWNDKSQVVAITCASLGIDYPKTLYRGPSVKGWLLSDDKYILDKPVYGCLVVRKSQVSEENGTVYFYWGWSNYSAYKEVGFVDVVGAILDAYLEDRGQVG